MLKVLFLLCEELLISDSAQDLLISAMLAVSKTGLLGNKGIMGIILGNAGVKDIEGGKTGIGFFSPFLEILTVGGLSKLVIRIVFLDFFICGRLRLAAGFRALSTRGWGGVNPLPPTLLRSQYKGPSQPALLTRPQQAATR